MNEPEQKTTEQRETGLPPALAWKLKDYVIGPEPEFGTPEWEDWIETRAMGEEAQAGRETEASQEASRSR